MAEKSPLSPILRTLRGQIGAAVQHARHDPQAMTAAARAAFDARFAAEVAASDPYGQLDPIERARRAEYLRRAHFTHLAYLSAAARAGRKAVRMRAERPWLPAPEPQAPAGGDHD